MAKEHLKLCTRPCLSLEYKFETGSSKLRFEDAFEVKVLSSIWSGSLKVIFQEEVKCQSLKLCLNSSYKSISKSDV